MKFFISFLIIIFLGISVSVNANSFFKGNKTIDRSRQDWRLVGTDGAALYYVNVNTMKRRKNGVINYLQLTEWDREDEVLQEIFKKNPETRRQFIQIFEEFLLDCRKMVRKNISRYHYEISQIGTKRWIKESVHNPGMFTSFKFTSKVTVERVKKVCEIASNKFK